MNLLITLGLGIVWVLPSGAMAKGKGSRDTREGAAKKACLLGDVDKGAEILADLYVETKDPTFVYNQGRCFEQNGKNNQALLRFKEYQRKAQKLTQEDRDDLQKRIETLEEALGQRQSPPVAPVSPPPPMEIAPSTLPAVAPPAANTDSPPDITQTALPPEPVPTPPFYKRWWFWTGVGAVVAGGVVTSVLLTRKSAPSSPACSGTAPCVR